jgi:hypothetical protein
MMIIIFINFNRFIIIIFIIDVVNYLINYHHCFVINRHQVQTIIIFIYYNWLEFN